MTTPSKAKLFTILRALCIGGERIEVGSLVDLGPVLASELKAAGKVRPATADEIADGTAAAAAADNTAKKPAEPTPVVRTRAKAEPAAETPAA